MQGTKRFTDKSGEYYLKNVQLQNSRQDPNLIVAKNSLNNPQNLENCLNRDINKIKKRASRIVTLLPENSLTPIPNKEGMNKSGIANKYGKKELDDAQRTAVFIRRMEYATSMKRQMNDGKTMKNHGKKIALIQEWWKTMYKIIKLQKNVRGFLFRKKLMSNLEHQEKLLQFITEFDNIYNCHLYGKFMENLKKKRDYEKAKLMEKCEDFNEKLDNLERMHNLKNFKNCFLKWKNYAKKKKKQDLENFAKKLNKIFKHKVNQNNLDAFKKIKQKNQSLYEQLNDKVKEFRKRNAKKKFLNHLIKSHRLNEKLSKVKKNVDDRQKRDALDKLKKYRDFSKALEKLNKLIEHKMKKNTFDDLKTMDFVDIVDDVIKKHNNKVNNDAKKEFFDKLKDIRNKGRLRDALKKWKDITDAMKKKNKIMDKLINYQQGILKKRAEEKKHQLSISSGVNEFELLSKKKDTPKKKEPIFATSQNDFNVEGKQPPKMIFEKEEQNFSLIAPEKIKFEFENPIDRMRKNDQEPLKNQLDDLDEFRNKQKLKRNNDIAKGVEMLEYLMNTKPKKEAFDKLKKNANIQKALEDLDKLLTRKLKEKFMNNLKKLNDLQKACDILQNLIDKKLLKKFFDNLRDYLPKKKTKRISRRTRTKKFRPRSKKNNNKNMMKDAFDIWREHASFEPTRDVLNKIKKNKLLNDNKKNEIIDRYKNKMLQVLLNIYKRQKNRKLKKYFDKWREIKNLLDEPEPKYKKKQKIGDEKEMSDPEYSPTYYNPKENIYTKRDSPYKKKYAKKPEVLEEPPEPNKDQYDDTSSNNESAIGNGEFLIQNTKVIHQARNYTSQSFFIDKKKTTSLTVISNYQLKTHNTNQLPMKMKGDFVSLMEQNPKLLTQKNPRIQVTNAMCDLDEIINDDNTEDEGLNSEEVDNEITKLNEDFVIDKNKVLSKVIKHCDKDIYAAQRPFRTKKAQYYSVSIPLNDNEAKWEFLNNIKGERDKNNLNKFELIQKENEPIIEENQERETPHKKNKSDKKNRNNNNDDDNSYRLREMNYSQYYRSPMKTPKVEEDEQTLIRNRIRRPGERKKTQKGKLNSTGKDIIRNRNNLASYNIDRSRGKIELDPQYRSIDFGKDDFDDSSDA